jgi:hypothetical protein
MMARLAALVTLLALLTPVGCPQVGFADLRARRHGELH